MLVHETARLHKICCGLTTSLDNNENVVENIFNPPIEYLSNWHWIFWKLTITALDQLLEFNITFERKYRTQRKGRALCKRLNILNIISSKVPRYCQHKVHTT